MYREREREKERERERERKGDLEVRHGALDTVRHLMRVCTYACIQ
jgi:hypothetical protein